MVHVDRLRQRRKGSIGLHGNDVVHRGGHLVFDRRLNFLGDAADEQFRNVLHHPAGCKGQSAEKKKVERDECC